MATRFVRFADPYRAMVEKQCRSVARSNVRDLPKRPYAAMMFWTAKVHERAGTNRLFPAYHRRAIAETIQEKLRTNPSDRSYAKAIRDNDFAENVWQKFKQKTKRKNKERTNKKLTIGPVKGILERLKEAREPNVITWLKKMQPQNAWKALQEKPQMNGIGPKLASFVLREVAIFCNGWQDQIENNGKFFQPVDTWVLRCCQSVWSQEQWPDEAPQVEKKYLVLAERIASHFANPIDAMNFNMGAWFVGANFQEIMAIHGVFYCGERLSPKKRLELTNSFDPNKITRALCYEADEVEARLMR